MHWTCHVARMGQSIDTYSFLIGYHKGERQHGRSTLRNVDNIKRKFRRLIQVLG